MAYIQAFPALLLIAGLVSLAAILVNKITSRVPIPAPAILLMAATGASALWPHLRAAIPTAEAGRVVTAALVYILFDGGMHIGWRRFRSAAAPVLALGVIGTIVTVILAAVVMHYGLGFGWPASAVIATAVSPTDPAVVFSVLGKREVAGRTATILEGESSANDPVGIALMAGVLSYVTWHHGPSGWSIALIFAAQMVIGVAVGVLGGMALAWFMRRVALPSEGLYPLRTAVAALVIYGLASIAHGSGFLAVLVAGVLTGDVRAPFKQEIARFHASLAALAEIVAFIVLGLTVHLHDLLAPRSLVPGLVLALVLAVVIRPLAIIPLLLPARLRWGERAFIAWAGLKGAVPVLLGTFVLQADVAGARAIYAIVVLVVCFSVLVQGLSVPFAARRLGVPMRVVEPHPWDLPVRLRQEPVGMERHRVAPGSPVDGAPVASLPLADGDWVCFVVRDGCAIPAPAEFLLRPKDELIILREHGPGRQPLKVFESAPAAERPGLASPPHLQ